MGEMVCIEQEEEEKKEEEEDEEEGECSAAVERSERRLQSLLMGKIGVCERSTD